MADSNVAPEVDLALIDALQLRPRAELGDLAVALGVSPATVARRWQSLQRRGLAWITVTVGRRYEGRPVSALATISCRAGHVAKIAALLRADNAAGTIATTLGRCQFLVDLFLPDMDALRHYVVRLQSLDGVIEVNCLPVATVYAEGSSWRVHALDPGQERSLQPRAAVGRSRPVPDQLDRALIAELSRDGRASWAQLAARCGVSAPTARRRIGALLDAGVIILRCEAAMPITGPVVPVTFLAHAPAAELPAIGRVVGQLPSCRLVASLIAASNLAVTVWLPTVADIEPFERSLQSQFPSLVIDDRIMYNATIKRAGHLLDSHYRTTGVVPLAAW